MTTRADIFMTFWVIYDHPKDHPDDWVVRRQYLVRKEGGGSEVMADRNATLHRTLHDARTAGVPPGLFCLPHQPGEPAYIHETWF